MIAQLRTGHCGLNGHLHRIGKIESSKCECGFSKETVEHFLLECPKYRKERMVMRKGVGNRKMRVEKLLREAKTIKHTVEYIIGLRAVPHNCCIVHCVNTYFLI